MKFEEHCNNLINEADGYKTFASVEKDLVNLSKEVKEIIKTKNGLMYDILTKDRDTVKVVIGQEVKSNAKVQKTGNTRGRKNMKKGVKVIKIMFNDSFWKDWRDAEVFFKVKDFNNWLMINRL